MLLVGFLWNLLQPWTRPRNHHTTTSRQHDLGLGRGDPSIRGEGGGGQGRPAQCVTIHLQCIYTPPAAQAFLHSYHALNLIKILIKSLLWKTFIIRRRFGSLYNIWYRDNHTTPISWLRWLESSWGSSWTLFFHGGWQRCWCWPDRWDSYQGWQWWWANHGDDSWQSWHRPHHRDRVCGLSLLPWATISCRCPLPPPLPSNYL